MLTLIRDDGYELDTDPDRLDLDRVHHWLSTDTYWAQGRSRERVAASFAASMPYGVYRADGRQVAVARVLTDGVSHAWLADVYVEQAERGQGLGVWLAETVRDEMARLGVRRIVLTTADAHGVYEKAGFTRIDDPERWMVLVDGRVL